MENLDRLRKEIDTVDERMTALFEQRMALVRDVVAYKTAHGLSIADPSREEDVIRRNVACIADRDIREYYVSFQQEVMQLSRDWQQQIMDEKI